VTSAYITPARGRLIAGQGAVVRLVGDDPEQRVLSQPAAIHGAISAEARSTPGYWEPPIPATVDVGLGTSLDQLPRTTMGAILALEELLDAASSQADLAEVYGPRAVRDLAPLVRENTPWRLSAVEAHEIGALIDLFGERQLPLVIDGAHGAGEFGEALAKLGARVIYEVPFGPASAGTDRGKGLDDPTPDRDVPARLVKAGVAVAITNTDSAPLSALRFAAAIASKGGLGEDAALASITRVPAEIYGVDDRIGSLAPGRFGDFAVFNGSPFAAGSTCLGTYVAGEVAWSPEFGRGEDAGEYSPAVVLRAEALHLGDGEVLRPGEVLVQNGKIAEVGERVGRPAGTRVISGRAVMPGVIDALGKLGLEGARRSPDTGFDLSRLVEPGDEIDRRVAAAGVTTVVMDPNGDNSGGAPMLAYHPASSDLSRAVVDAPAAVRLSWSESDRSRSGQSVRSVLEKAQKYVESWDEYEEKLAKWKPEEVRPDFRLPSKEEDEEEEEEEEEDKKKKNRGLEKDPITGIWVAQVGEDEQRLRVQLRLKGESVEGWLRFAGLSDELLEVSGTYVAEEVLDEDGESKKKPEFTNTLVLEGRTDAGPFRFEGSLNDPLEEPEEAVVVEGALTLGETSFEVAAERTSREYPAARRSEPSDDAAEEGDDGKPREPKVDPDLEPYRRAMAGKAAVLVRVTRRDEIVDCVNTFAEFGIRPVLLGADEIFAVLGQVKSRISGVILAPESTAPTQFFSISPSGELIIETIGGGGGRSIAELASLYSRLQRAGVPVAFFSGAEEGAADLLTIATYAVLEGMSPAGALRALTSDTAAMFAIGDRVGRIAPGLDADLLLLDGEPLSPATSVLRAWVAGEEVR
jgi:imidazolonepropionase-like amidohydrolase